MSEQIEGAMWKRIPLSEAGHTMIYIGLINAKLPMLVQKRGDEWWSIGVAEKKIERGLTHVLVPEFAPVAVRSADQQAASEAIFSRIIEGVSTAQRKRNGDLSVLMTISQEDWDEIAKRAAKTDGVAK